MAVSAGKTLRLWAGVLSGLLEMVNEPRPPVAAHHRSFPRRWLAGTCGVTPARFG